MQNQDLAVSSRLQQDLRGIICRITGLPDDFDPNAHLYLDLGVASLHALQLLTEIEEHYSVHMPDEQFVEATSLCKMAALVQAVMEKPSA